MHPDISAFPSAVFYGNSLRNGDNTHGRPVRACARACSWGLLERPHIVPYSMFDNDNPTCCPAGRPAGIPLPPPLQQRVTFVDVDGWEVGPGTSRSNPHQAKEVREPRPQPLL